MMTKSIEFERMEENIGFGVKKMNVEDFNI